MSSETRYTIEFAKSSRSSCKKCKEKIEKDAVRIGSHAHNLQRDIIMTGWYHPTCFSLPRKYSSGPQAMSVVEFISNVLEDTSGEIFPSQCNDIAYAISSKAPSSARGKKKVDDDDEEGGAVDHTSLLGPIKAAFEEREKMRKNGEEPSAKKIKSIDSQTLDLYEKHRSSKVDELKDILRWNRQVLTGKKDFILFKVIDGEQYGRLAHCTLCGGKLKMAEDGTVVCNGAFNEDLRVRMSCMFSSPREDAPRLNPWYSSEPTDDQKEEMDKQEEDADNNSAGNVDVDSDPDVSKLIQGVSSIEWNLSTSSGLKNAASSIIDLFENYGGNKTLDLSEDKGSARVKVGTLLTQHRDMSASDAVKMLIKEIGFREVKAAGNAKKEAAIESAIKEPKNAGLIAAFQELAGHYFKEGNGNAGATYNKVVKALYDLPFEVTPENAKGLCKGSTKVSNIGKASADKIYEYVTTGTIGKLEEKRSNQA